MEDGTVYDDPKSGALPVWFVQAMNADDLIQQARMLYNESNAGRCPEYVNGHRCTIDRSVRHATHMWDKALFRTRSRKDNT